MDLLALVDAMEEPVVAIELLQDARFLVPVQHVGETPVEAEQMPSHLRGGRSQRDLGIRECRLRAPSDAQPR